MSPATSTCTRPGSRRRERRQRARAPGARRAGRPGSRRPQRDPARRARRGDLGRKRDPIGLLIGPGRVAGGRAGADPARPDAGLPVHLLPRRRAADGGRPGAHPRLGAAGPAVRRRPPGQLRRVRLAGAAAGVRHQRLRRDAARARSSGTSSGWPRAWPSPARDNGFTRKERKRVVRAGVAGYRTTMREFAEQGRWPSGTPTSTSRPPVARLPRPGRAQGAQASARPRAGQGAHRDSRQALDKLTTVVDGRRRIISDPPTVVPIEELFSGMERETDLRADRRRARAVPAHPAVRPPAPAGAVRPGPGGPQGRRRRQRRHARVDRAARGRRRRRPLFLQAKEAQPSVLARLRRTPAATATRASGSSPAST